jgi:hypothetical protein
MEQLTTESTRTETTLRVGARDVFLTEAAQASGPTRETPLVLLHGWEPKNYEGISIWGHTVVGDEVATQVRRFQAAVRSLREREGTVPALSAVPRR